MERPHKRQRTSKVAARLKPRREGSGRTSAEKPQFVHQTSDLTSTSPSLQCDDCSNQSKKPSSPRHSRKASKGKGTIFHRRQAAENAEPDASPGLTVTVQAHVNPSGSTTAVVTLPTVPTVVPYPSNLTPPAVPTESPFPSLTVPTVPSYPFTTTTSQTITNAGSTGPEASASASPSETSESEPGEGMIGLTATGNEGTSQVVLSPPPTPNPSAPSASPFPSGVNSTASLVSAAGISSASLSTFSASENVTTSTFTTFPDGSFGLTTITFEPPTTTEPSSSISNVSPSLGASAISSLVSAVSLTSSSASASGSVFSSASASSIASSSAASSSSPQASSTSNVNGAGGASGTGSAGSPSSVSSSVPAAAPATNGSNTTPTPVVVGGVVGGVAGLALLLVLALLILRWYKRRDHVRQPLTGDDGEAAPGAMMQPTSRAPPLAAAAGLLHRFSAPRTPPEPPQRGFQRVSGRKIPSMFSGARPDAEPMDPFADPTPGDIPPDTSFYRDSEGFFGMGTGAAAAAAGAAAGAATHERPSNETASIAAPEEGVGEEEKFMPGPARTPVLHPGGPYSPLVVGPTPEEGSNPLEQPPDRMLTPTSAVGSAAGPGTLGRSHPSFDGSRGSRFTENVE